jgi:hypothetical protein
MKTLKEYYYTYYSYEEYGRGYFGSRGCECLPEEDINYFGSFRDKTFKPTQKIILGIYETREEAYADEIILHDYYDVANNPHFANRANATSTKFYVPIEKAKETGKKVAQNNKELGIGIFSFTSDKRSEMGKVGGTKSYQLGVGIHALTSEERKECGKMGGKKAHKTQQELGIGFWGLTLEQRQENAKKGEEKRKKEGLGLYGLTTEERSEAGKKSAQKLHSERWMCEETGHITNAGALTRFQKHRGIDTSKRKQVA